MSGNNILAGRSVNAKAGSLVGFKMVGGGSFKANVGAEIIKGIKKITGANTADEADTMVSISILSDNAIIGFNNIGTIRCSNAKASEVQYDMEGGGTGDVDVSVSP